MKKLLIATAAIVPLMAATPTLAQDGVEIGLLECVIEGGTGLVFGSSRELACTFNSADEAMAPEPYYGVVNRFGLDVGVTGETVMQWLVFAPTADYFAPGVLAGNYVGASAEASAAVGVGANVLIGGSDQTVTLQPVSVQAQTGLNIAIGVSEFQLRSGI